MLYSQRENEGLRLKAVKAVLHIGNVAGVPQELSKAQIKLGLKSDVLSFHPHPFEYKLDLYCSSRIPHYLKSSRIGPYLVNIDEMSRLITISKNYDILHFHWPTLLRKGRDIAVWKSLGKKVIIHHHGSDIRYKGEYKLCKKFADKIFVSTPDLLEWSPTAAWIPNPVSLDSIPYIGVEEKDKSDYINILHAPSARNIKGTDFVINAVNNLKDEGYKANLVLVENMPHAKAMEEYKKADIVVDQLLIGWYGVFAVECMALGKPVCVYINHQLKKYMLPGSLVNSSPETIEENLRTLIEDERLRKELGKRARRYVENVHNADKVGQKVIDLYLNKA